MIAQFLLIGDTGPRAVGRPPNNVLRGPTRQLDIISGVAIVEGLIAEAVTANEQIDPDLLLNFGPQGKRNYVSQIFGSLSAIKDKDVIGREVASLYESMGPMIRMRKNNPVKRGEGGHHVYILKETADAVSVRGAVTARADGMTARKNRDTARQLRFERGLKAYFEHYAGLRFGEAYAAEGRDYYEANAK